MPKESSARMESPLLRAYGFARLAALVGIMGGLGLSIPILLITGRFPLGLIVAFGVGGFVAGFGVGLVLREGGGGLVEFALGGSRGHTKPEFSRQQSLVARGAYREAMAEYAAAADDAPHDPEPLLLGARVLRDHLGEHAEAAEWLRRALRIEGLTPQAEATLVRELTDLYEGPLNTPRRALPELARLAAKYAGTRTGEWAGRRLAALRTRSWDDVKGVE
jgi:tetratricopeptide (TPR) repeat protein